MQAKEVAELDGAQQVRALCAVDARDGPVSPRATVQHIAALLDTSARVLAAAAAGERIQVLADTDAFMTTAQVPHVPERLPRCP